MCAQHRTFRILRIEFRNDPRPEQTRCSHFGNLHIEVHANAPEEGQARCKFVDTESCSDRCADIFFTVSERVCQLQCGVSARLLKMISGDGNCVKSWHIGRAISDDVTDNFHARRRRINIGIAYHELFKNIVLYGAGQLRLLYTLLLCRHNVAGQNWKHRTVHGHRDRYLV